MGFNFQLCISPVLFVLFFGGDFIARLILLETPLDLMAEK